MGNKPGHELSPEEKLKLKEEKEREKKFLKERKERKKREKKEEKKRKKDKKRQKDDNTLPVEGEEDEDTESVGGSSAWSEKSVGSASGSWYHSASEPSSKRSSIYLPASAGPGYYQHECWYPGYEDTASEKSKSLSRSSSVKDTLNVRAGSLERYPLGVPKADPIEPLHKAGSLDLSSVAAKYDNDQEQTTADAEVAVTITSRRETSNRRSRDRLERTSIDRASPLEKSPLTEHISVDRASPYKKAPLTENVYTGRASPYRKSPLTEHVSLDRTSPFMKAPLGENASLDRTSPYRKPPSTENINAGRASPYNKVPLTEPVSVHQTTPFMKVPASEHISLGRTSPLRVGHLTENTSRQQTSSFKESPLIEPLPIHQASPLNKIPLTEPLSTEWKSPFKKVPATDHTPLPEGGRMDSTVDHSVDDGFLRGEKRKTYVEDRDSFSVPEVGFGSDTKRPSLDHGSDRVSLTGSVYYSADEGSSIAGSIYYSATSGSEVEDHGDDYELLGKERPSAPGKPEAVDREGSVLSRLAYIKVENDALLLKWDAPITDGGSPITGYIIERCEGQGEMWVRVNLVPVKDTEYAVANLVGGREYRFRVSAENAVGMSDSSMPSEMVSVSLDQEATEPHFLKELRDAVAVENQRIEFSVDIIGTPAPDITWFKDGFEVYDTKRFEFLADGDRYALVLKEAKLNDEGDIRVRASNRVGVASSQATLAVQAPPQIVLPAQYEQGLIFDTDELIRLRVPYTGRPQPQASWTHNGKQLEADERRTMDVSDKYATVKIAGASRLDKGMYTVKLSNPQGLDTASFFVTVTDRPDPPSVPTITDVSGTSVTLRWDAPHDDGGCRITNYIIEYFRVGWDVWLKAGSSRITWTQLADLIVGSEYRFRVKAENAYGVSEPGRESDQILIEDKSPTGYEYLGSNVGTCTEHGYTTGEGGTKLNHTNISKDTHAHSGMVIEALSLKTSQEHYWEELALRNRKVKSLTFRLQGNETAMSRETRRLQHSQETDDRNCHTTISNISEDGTSSTHLGILSHDAGERCDVLISQELQEQDTINSAKTESTDNALAIHFGTLSLDQRSFTESVVSDQVKAMDADAVQDQSGILRDDLTPGHHGDGSEMTVTENRQTRVIDSGSQEWDTSGTNFIATVQVYHTRAAPGDPCTFQTPNVDGLNPHSKKDQPSNNKIINLDRPTAERPRTKDLESSPTNLEDFDLSTEVVKNVGAGRSLDRPARNLCDEGSMPVGITPEEALRRSGVETSAKLVPKDVIKCHAAEPAVRNVCGLGASADHVIRNVGNQGTSAIQTIRSTVKDRHPAPQMMRNTGNEAASPYVIRNIKEEKSAAGQGMRTISKQKTLGDEADDMSGEEPAGKHVVERTTMMETTSTQVVADTSNKAVTDIDEEGTAANQVTRNFTERVVGVDQGTRNSRGEEFVGEEGVRNVVDKKGSRVKRVERNKEMKAMSDKIVRIFNEVSTANVLVGDSSEEVPTANLLVGDSSELVSTANVLVGDSSAKVSTANLLVGDSSELGFTANVLAGNSSEEVSTANLLGGDMSEEGSTVNQIVSGIHEAGTTAGQEAKNVHERPTANQARKHRSQEGPIVSIVVRNNNKAAAKSKQVASLSNEGATANQVVSNIRKVGATANPIVMKSIRLGATANVLARKNNEEGTTANMVVRSSSEEGATANRTVRKNSEERTTAKRAVRSISKERATANGVVRNSSEERATANGVVRNSSEERATANRAVWNSSEEGTTANGVARTSCEEIATANRKVRKNSEEGTTAKRALRSISKERATANGVVRNSSEEGATANRILRDSSEKGPTDNGVEWTSSPEGGATANDVEWTSSTEEGATANGVEWTSSSEEGATANVEGRTSCSEEGATANSVELTSCSEEGATANGVEWTRSSEEGATADQVVRDSSTKGPRNSSVAGVTCETYAAGEQWTARGRMAIANQFRIICGGLASMTNLGNISLEDPRQEETAEVQGFVRGSEKSDEHSDSVSCNGSATREIEARGASPGGEDVEKDLENESELFENETIEAAHQDGFICPDGSLMNTVSKRREGSLPYHKGLKKGHGTSATYQGTTSHRDEATELEVINNEETSSNGLRTVTHMEDVDLNNVDVYDNHITSVGEDGIINDQVEILKYECTTNNQTRTVKRTTFVASQEDSKVYSEAAMKVKRNVFTHSGRSLDIDPQSTSMCSRKAKPHSGSASGTAGLQKSRRYDFGRAAEDTICAELQPGDYYSPSWEPNISDMITSRIDLLEGLVYRCLENEDVAMNSFGASDDEGLGIPSPLAPLSPVGSAGRVDARRRELRDLISDLGEIVSSMNEKSRTLSAENIAKFFEKTASVARDHSMSPAGQREAFVDSKIKSNRGSRTPLLCDVDGFLRNLSNRSEATSLASAIQPFDHVSIQSSILDRITYLDELMSRCLEHEDVTLNTLGSPMVSPYPAPSADRADGRIDASKNELKDLIGNLGSMVVGLGQKFNAH